MKKEEIAIIALKETMKIFDLLDPDTRLWILEGQLPQYICMNCGDYVTDCECNQNETQV